MPKSESSRPGYWIVQGEPVSNTEAMTEYGKLWGPVAQKFGAQVIAASEAPDIVEGFGPGRIVIVRFPSFQAAKDCYNSAAYQRAAKFGRKAGRRTVLVLKGAEDAI